MSIESKAHLPVVADDPAWDLYRHAVERTNALIDQGHQRSATPEKTRQRALDRMERLRALLRALDHPNDAYPIVHIAGTSGKGSTATAIASILTAAGYRSGLHTSPYLQAATEKIQINGKLIDGADFSWLVNAILDTAATMPAFKKSPITYGEAWVAMSLLWFARSGTDVVVLETGAGGRFDLTNVVTPVASVITSIGFDHTETLGSTIAEIAWHKAGIIKQGVPAITAVDDAEALKVIAREAEIQRSRLVQAPGPGAATTTSTPTSQSAGVDFHQSNMALATAAAAELANSGFTLTERDIRSGIECMRIPGRIELMQHEPLVLLDGAHNPQKMQALAGNLIQLAPPGPGGTRTVIFGALETKNQIDMLDALMPLTDRFVLTAPQVFGKRGFEPGDLADQIRTLGFMGELQVVEEPLAALAIALDQSKPDDAVVVTGSMYLVGNLREHWYPTRDIVVQRTPWPDTEAERNDTPGGFR